MSSESSEQNFVDLRDQILVTGEFYEDPDFRPTKKSLGVKAFKKWEEEIDFSEIKWLRPREICDDPKFVLDGSSRFDVQQGGLGNCWFLAALSSLGNNKKLFEKAVPKENNYDCDFDSDYAGMFVFRFWKSGEWVEVIIDDRLPTVDGCLKFTQAPNDEFWPALYEKAYAKFYGSYGALIGGLSCEAFVDITGGIMESYSFNSMPKSVNLFDIIQKGIKRGSLIATGTSEHGKFSENLTENFGLVSGHAFTLTAAEYVETKTGEKLQLVRIRNPWGNKTEWKGLFCDGSVAWNCVEKSVKEKMEVERKNGSGNGEFCMEFYTFLHFFDDVDLCHLSPDDFVDDDEEDKETEISRDFTWSSETRNDEWLEDVENSPQFIIHLEDLDEDDDEELCTLIVSLMQKNRREFGLESLAIGFDIYPLKKKHLALDDLGEKFFDKISTVAKFELEETPVASARFKLEPGFYAIIPKNQYNEAEEFALKVITEGKEEKKNVIVKVNKVE